MFLLRKWARRGGRCGYRLATTTSMKTALAITGPPRGAERLDESGTVMKRQPERTGSSQKRGEDLQRSLPGYDLGRMEFFSLGNERGRNDESEYDPQQRGQPSLSARARGADANDHRCFRRGGNDHVQDVPVRENVKQKTFEGLDRLTLQR